MFLPNFIKQKIKLRAQRLIVSQVRNGIVPKDMSVEDIWNAFKAVLKPNQTELYGTLEAKVFNPDGSLRKDYGLVSVKEVSVYFANRIVDAMCSSGEIVNEFTFHGMGAGSTAETDTQNSLIAEKGPRGSGACTHGATSNIMQAVLTMTAASAFGCREHGIFDTLSDSGSGDMLDRSLVTNIELNTDDNVEWTYNLTVAKGG